nr:hypothetical protein [Tanacetum cinerariifolium]
MLHRTDFASWQKCIRLYCRGKENRVNILKSIDEGPFQMGTVWETLAERTKGAPQLGPEQPQVYSDLSPEEKDRGLRDSNYDRLYANLKQHATHANENKMMLDCFTQHIVDPLALMFNVSHQQHYSQSASTLPSTYVPPHLADNAHLDSGLSSTDNLIENLTNALALLTPSYKTFLPQTNNQLRTSSNTRNQATVQDGRVVVQNVQGRQNRDNYDVFDSNVDEAPTAQTMFMVNLSTADPVYDEAGPSYDSDILSERVLIIGTSQSRQHDMSEPVSYHLTGKITRMMRRTLDSITSLHNVWRTSSKMKSVLERFMDDLVGSRLNSAPLF